MDVLGLRLAVAGHPLATGILAGVAAAVWLVLTYGVPASLLLARSHDSVVDDVNGTWLLRWLTVPMTAQTLSPPSWILMGAPGRMEQHQPPEES